MKYEASFIFKMLRDSAGKVTLSQWRGLNLLKQKITENHSNTPAQQKQKVIFAALVQLSRRFGEAASVGLASRPRKQDPVNAFASLNAGVVTLSGEGVLAIDYPAIACSNGSLRAPKVTVTEEGGVLTFMHDAEKNGFDCYETDRLYAVLFEEELMEVRVEELNQRKDSDPKPVTLEEGWKKENLHIYLFYRREKGKQASKTVYVKPE